MKQSISNPTNACINLMYFFTNFPSNFIEKCWEDEPNIVGHLKSKFNSFCEQYGSDLGINKLFYELDRENQRKLIDWINKNYISFNDLKDVESITYLHLIKNINEENIKMCWEGEHNSITIQQKFKYFFTLTSDKKINNDMFFYSLSDFEKYKMIKWLTDNQQK